MYKIGLIGLGMSGIRFAKAINYLYETTRKYRLIAVYDLKPINSTWFVNMNTKYCNSVQEFCSHERYDLIIIATNEHTHYDLLLELKQKSIRTKRILVEKPLAETIEQTREIYNLYGNNIFVNYIERFSEASMRIKKYIANNELTLFRILFMWGKNRLGDLRPTIGIISELVHPLDLCLFLSDSFESECTIKSCNTIKSVYSISPQLIADSINVTMNLNNLLISGCSSFAWVKRRRELVLYLMNSNKQLFIINVWFDSPQWDIDSYTIYRQNEQNEWIKINEYITDNQRNVETKFMTKIIKALKKLCTSLSHNDIVDENLPNLFESIKLQEIISKIQNLAQHTDDINLLIPHNRSVNMMEYLPINYVDALQDNQY